MKRNAGILFAAACAAFLLSTGCSTAEPAPETPLAPDGSEKKYVQVQDDPLFADVFGTTTISRPHNPALLISESDYRKAKTQKNIRGINTHLILHNRIWPQKDFIYNPHQQYLQRATVAILQQKAEQTYGKLTGMREIPLREIKKDPFGIVFRYKLLFDCIDPKTGQTHTVFFLHQETVLMAGDHYLVILSRYSSGDPKDIADCEKGSDDFYRFIRKNFQTLPTCKHLRRPSGSPEPLEKPSTHAIFRDRRTRK